MEHKIIELGKYKIEIEFDSETNNIDVSLYDTLGNLIESISVIEDEDDADIDDTNMMDIGFSLN